jgi:hypothetical protein
MQHGEQSDSLCGRNLNATLRLDSITVLLLSLRPHLYTSRFNPKIVKRNPVSR